VPPTGEELLPPTFVHLIDAEEITPGKKHVLALGITQCIKGEDADDSMTIDAIARLVTEQGGVAFLPHPGASIPDKEKLYESIRIQGSSETRLSAFCIRNAEGVIKQDMSDSVCVMIAVLTSDDGHSRTLASEAKLIPIVICRSNACRPGERFPNLEGCAVFAGNNWVMATSNAAGLITRRQCGRALNAGRQYGLETGGSHGAALACRL